MTKLTGLIAAPFTPMSSKGELHLEVIADYARLLRHSGVAGVFIGGTTGEGMSLSVEEREALTETWMAAAGDNLRVVVHVGDTRLGDCQRLAAHAQARGAHAIGQMAPCFFKPGSLEALVGFCAETAAAAPALPYYYYHMPSMTGVSAKMVDFLKQASDRIPSLAGIKYTHEDLMEFQLCRQVEDGRFDMLFGRDELLICGLTLGCGGAVGSTYNYLAPLYLDLWEAFSRGDLQSANQRQLMSMRIIQTLFDFGNPLVCGKALMAMLGVDCGPPRSPLTPLDPSRIAGLRQALTSLGFFDHCCRQNSLTV